MDQITPRKVLIVDDDDAVRDSMRVLLESFGFDVRDYRSAREFLSGSTYADGCLLLDLHMPGMSGMELLELLRAEGSRLPVIIITGRSDPKLKERALQSGAVALLDKPAEESVLMQALDRAFGVAPAPIDNFSDTHISRRNP